MPAPVATVMRDGEDLELGGFKARRKIVSCFSGFLCPGRLQGRHLPLSGTLGTRLREAGAVEGPRPRWALARLRKLPGMAMVARRQRWLGERPALAGAVAPGWMSWVWPGGGWAARRAGPRRPGRCCGGTAGWSPGDHHGRDGDGSEQPGRCPPAAGATAAGCFGCGAGRCRGRSAASASAVARTPHRQTRRAPARSARPPACSSCSRR
jgi:hypothetical protein